MDRGTLGPFKGVLGAARSGLPEFVPGSLFFVPCSCASCARSDLVIEQLVNLDQKSERNLLTASLDCLSTVKLVN